MKKTCVLLFFLLSYTLSHAQNYKQHSLFIFGFTRYVQWPDAYNEGDFEIMILGDTPLIDELKSMAQTKRVGDRVIKITKINSPKEIRKCNILFIPMDKSSLFSEISAKVNNQPILMVTEDPGLGAKGSNINFVIKEGKLFFELNQSTVSKQNLKVSNELSRLAILI